MADGRVIWIPRYTSVVHAPPLEAQGPPGPDASGARSAEPEARRDARRADPDSPIDEQEE